MLNVDMRGSMSNSILLGPKAASPNILASNACNIMRSFSFSVTRDPELIWFLGLL